MSVCVHEEVVYKQTNQPEKAIGGKKCCLIIIWHISWSQANFYFYFQKSQLKSRTSHHQKEFLLNVIAGTAFQKF